MNEQKEKKYWFGNPVSQYGMENGYVDYRCLAKAFKGVLANDLRKQTDGVIGYWDIENGYIDYYEDTEGNRYSYDEKEKRVEELEQEKELRKSEILEMEVELSNLEIDLQYLDENDNPDEILEKINEVSLEIKEANDRIKEIDEDIDTLEDEYINDIFQEFIIDDNGARILKDYTNEIVFYNEKMDLYIWGVTHYGTSWDYVLTDIKLD